MANSELVLGSTEGRPIGMQRVKLVKADGVKTYSQLLDSLYNDALAEIQAGHIIVLRWSNVFLKNNRIQFPSLDTIGFQNTNTTGSDTYIYNMTLRSSSSYYLSNKSSSISTIDNLSNTVPTNTMELELLRYVVL